MLENSIFGAENYILPIWYRHTSVANMETVFLNQKNSLHNAKCANQWWAIFQLATEQTHWTSWNACSWRLVYFFLMYMNQQCPTTPPNTHATLAHQRFIHETFKSRVPSSNYNGQNLTSTDMNNILKEALSLIATINCRFFAHTEEFIHTVICGRHIYNSLCLW